MRSSVGDMTNDAQIHPFRIEIPQEDLDDLRHGSRGRAGPTS